MEELKEIVFKTPTEFTLTMAVPEWVEWVAISRRGWLMAWDRRPYVSADGKSWAVQYGAKTCKLYKVHCAGVLDRIGYWMDSLQPIWPLSMEESAKHSVGADPDGKGYDRTQSQEGSAADRDDAAMSIRGANAKKVFDLWMDEDTVFNRNIGCLAKYDAPTLKRFLKMAAGSVLLRRADGFANGTTELIELYAAAEATAALAVSIVVKSRGHGDAADVLSDVVHHINTYTVPQYGDAGNDQVGRWTAEDCFKQAQKYINRIGTSRRNEGDLDMLKLVHYLQLAFEKLEDARGSSPETTKETKKND